MPSATITNDTCLLTERGWSSAGSAAGQTIIFGTDRHGHLVSRDVTIASASRSSRRVIIGTDGALGVFAPETRLILKDGTSRAAKDIAEDSHAGDLWFENVIHYPNGTDGSAAGECFARELQRSAAFVVDGAAAIRCKSRDVLDWEKVSGFKCCEFLKAATDVYCLVRPDAFPELRGAPFYKAIRALGAALFRNSEEECDEFDCCNSGPCLWYATALSALKVGHVFTYDTIQYSLFVKVVEDSSHKPPFRRCRCAFLEAEVDGAVQLGWESNSWTPIVSGFLISGR